MQRAKSRFCFGHFGSIELDLKTPFLMPALDLKISQVEIDTSDVKIFSDSIQNILLPEAGIKHLVFRSNSMPLRMP